MFWKRFPGGEFELFLRKRGEPVSQHRGSIQDVSPILENHCESFPAPIVRYNPKHPYGILAHIACDCPERAGLHVFDWATYVEIVDASGRPVPPGDLGEVCVTLLTNFSMPLIRFRIGDTAVAARGPCPCGRPMPLLQSVAGRITEHFVRRDGTLVHGQYFAFMF